MRNDCRFEKDWDANKYCQVGAIIGAVATVAGAAISSSSAGDAADAQTDSSNAQIAEARRQFDSIQKLLAPYTNAGPGALTGQQDLLGLNGQGAQFKAIDAIAGSPQMTALTQQGENAILQNASATGGLRGGNIQAALSQFRPQLLNALIDQQYNRYGGLATLGQNSAAGVGAAGQNSSSQVIAALQQRGAAQAGGAVAQGNAANGLINGLSNAAGFAYGNGGLGGQNQQSSATLPYDYNPYGSSFGGENFGSGGFQNNGFTGYGA